MNGRSKIWYFVNRKRNNRRLHGDPGSDADINADLSLTFYFTALFKSSLTCSKWLSSTHATFGTGGTAGTPASLSGPACARAARHTCSRPVAPSMAVR